MRVIATGALFLIVCAMSLILLAVCIEPFIGFREPGEAIGDWLRRRWCERRHQGMWTTLYFSGPHVKQIECAQCGRKFKWNSLYQDKEI